MQSLSRREPLDATPSVYARPVVGRADASDYADMQARLARAELQVLMLQLQPHVQLNTLHLIAELIHTDAEAAERVITRLGDLLRLLLENAAEAEIPLSRELELLQVYLEIARERFPELEVEIAADEQARSAWVPPFVLQPLVENTVRHGLGPRLPRARISVTARRVRGRLQLVISDNGKGLPSGRSRIAERVGLGNTRARFQRLYGAAYRIDLRNGAHGGATLTVTIPFRTNGVRALAQPSRRRRTAACLLACILLAALPSAGRAQSTAAVSTTPSGEKPCAAPEFRQFDFWIGDWAVQTPDGKPAGTNRVVSILDGCVVQENWVGVKGMSGTSFNKYYPPLRRWHQTWVDDRGGFLLLSGEFKDGKMTLAGEMPDPGGGKVLHRITWQRVAETPERVRQLWESSRDGGATWTVTFDGIYMRK